MYKKLFNKNNLNSDKGFTLLEVIVVVAIFGIMTAVIIFNYSNFNSKVILTNMAYEIALTTRQAQVFGLGARSGDTTVLDLAPNVQFESPFGMYFDLRDGTGPKANTTDQFIMFVDEVNKQIVDGGEITVSDHFCKNGPTKTCTCSSDVTDECVNKFQMQRGMYISDLRVFNTSSSCTPTRAVAISFKRPNPDGIIVDQERGTATTYRSLQITVTSKNGDNEYVIMRENGQLAVQSNPICS